MRPLSVEVLQYRCLDLCHRGNTFYAPKEQITHHDPTSKLGQQDSKNVHLQPWLQDQLCAPSTYVFIVFICVYEVQANTMQPGMSRLPVISGVIMKKQA